MSTNAQLDDQAAVALAAVGRIDLDPINAKLRYDDPSLWTDELIAETELNYRRFLALTVMNPDTSLSVNKALDEYWHQHILDTRKYAADCEVLFGRLLHHDPYFGLENEEEWQENVDQFAVTQRIWEEAFGVRLVNEPRLTLDKPIGGHAGEPESGASSRIYAFPQNCKSSQHHCSKIIEPDRLEPEPEILPEEPFRSPREPVEPTREPGRERE